ncbi:hypothetical protein [Streptomyces sp. 16-176A]
MLIATNGLGLKVKRPSKPAVGTMLGNLRRGNEYLILERQGEEREGDWYIQVWFRDDNTYQLEYRDGVPAEHYQTRTMSQEKVLEAFRGWMLGKPDWRDAFMWNNIGQMFVTDSEGHQSEEGATS